MFGFNNSLLFLSIINLLFTTSYSNDHLSLITNHCKSTQSSDLCSSILVANPQSKEAKDLKGLSRVGIESLIEKINQTKSLFADHHLNEDESVKKVNVEDCIEILRLMKYYLEKGVVYFEKGDYESVKNEILFSVLGADVCAEADIMVLYKKEAGDLASFGMVLMGFMDRIIASN